MRRNTQWLHVWLGGVYYSSRMMVAMMIEDFLDELGCNHTGPYAGVTEALRAIEAGSFDLALLDINLNGEISYPIARHLERIGVPFVFVSGYEKFDNAEWRYPHITKPFKVADLEAAMMRALSLRPETGPKQVAARFAAAVDRRLQQLGLG